MKRSEVLKILNKLKPLYESIDAGVEEIEKLISLASKLPDVKESKKVNWDSLDAMPEEIKGLDRAFAIFSDGACRGNPGPGSWGTIIQSEKGEILLKSSGVDLPTTNNKMELEGAIQGLKGLIDRWIEQGVADRDTPVFLYSDSKYVIEGLKSWVSGWKSRGWKKADGKDPENIEQWKELDSLRANFNRIEFIWVKGHAGHPQNEMCDQMCNVALDEAGY